MMPKFAYRFKTLSFVEIVKLLYNAKTWSISSVAVSGNIFVFIGRQQHAQGGQK
jgi:hypothetical protein